MSHDQKPTRMRVVANARPPAQATPQRRRSDQTDKAAISATATTRPGLLPGAAQNATRASENRPTTLILILFVIGCAAGGALLPLLGWV